ncbi:hypothetical protein [Spiroplasma diminutum]|uniref:Transmembrane protein n=1 Tax=Spiroplasma diminutum CUAS-1 TaxID=1276221 RepID=S5MDL8_9MOLU|nr:hypothetical protein [Spiroplasma diminutum]AGR41813.1 hypothetical protein SDIMI_v3c01090 [Spiroplasma diminutum CUAS-1]
MKNFIKIFNPSNNWKTTFILILILAILTFFLALFMGYQFTDGDGNVYSFKLLSKNYDRSLKYIYEIFSLPSSNQTESGIAIKNSYDASNVYALISNYNLLAYILWFILPIGFILNQFRLSHLIGKTRRTVNATIILITSIVLLILIINYWIGYFQWINLLNDRRFEGINTWGYNWRTVVQQSLLIIGVGLFIAISCYNVFVENKVKYLYISEKQK